MNHTFRSRRAFMRCLAASWPAMRLLKAQEKETTFSSDVKVVNIFATVRDKKGQIISVLGKDDFTVTEDGRPQVIKYFSRETDLPLTLGLLVDTSLSQRRVLGQEKTASFRFIDRVLRADRDKTFIIHFDHESELLQDLTSSRPELQRALDQLELPADGQPQLNRGGGNSGGGGGGGYPSGGIGFPGMGGGGRGRRGGGGYPQQRRASGPGTTMYDAIYLASNEIMKKQQGRKAIILLTDGVDNGSKTFLNDAIEAAQRADTLAYSILFSDESAYGGGGLAGMSRRPPSPLLPKISGASDLPYKASFTCSSTKPTLSSTTSTCSTPRASCRILSPPSGYGMPTRRMRIPARSTSASDRPSSRRA